MLRRIIESYPDPRFKGELPPEGVRGFVYTEIPIAWNPNGQIFYRLHQETGITVQGRHETDGGLSVTIERPGSTQGTLIKQTTFIGPDVKDDVIVHIHETKTTYRITTKNLKI